MNPFFLAGAIFIEHMTGIDKDWDVTGWLGPAHCLKGFNTKASNPYTTIVEGPAVVGNPQIAPGNSYRMINFENGNHNGIAVWGPNGAEPKVMLNIGFARWHFDHHATEYGDGWAPRSSTSKAEIMTVNSSLNGTYQGRAAKSLLRSSMQALPTSSSCPTDSII